MNKLTTLIAFLIAWACWFWVVGCLIIAAIAFISGTEDATPTGILFLFIAAPGLIGHEINKRFVRSTLEHT